MNRIQKLLFSDYSDFEDIVLLESPFAETDRHGDGIRQVHMGLTPTKVIIARDVVQPAQDVDFSYCFGLDPEIENFELISLYPTEHVNLSIFRRKERQTIKAHFSNGVVKYFELGGFNRRQMFWNLWCERILYLHPIEVGSNSSETSVASTMSGSTLYIKYQKVVITDTGKTQFWHQYDATYNTNYKKLHHCRWSEGNVLNGKKELEILPRHKSIPYGSPITELKSFHEDRFKLTPRSQHSWPSSCSQFLPLSNASSEKSVKKVNRFGSGIPENCQINLFLTHEQDKPDINWDCTSVPLLNSTEKNSYLCEKELYMSTSVLPEKQSLIDSLVLQWEDTGVRKMRHTRRYGFSPEPHLMNGVGLINVAGGDLYSIQIKRAVSAVCLSVPLVEEMIHIQTQRTFLSLSTSYDTLSTQTIVTTWPVEKQKPCRFWVAKKCYHLKPVAKRYQYLQKMLKKINEFHCKQMTGNGENRKHTSTNTSKFSKKKGKTDDLLNLQKLQLVERAKYNSSKSFIHRVTTRGKRKGKIESVEIKESESPGDTNFTYGKSFLTLHDSSYRIRAIHIDCSALAYQLTMIDRELFLNITSKEVHTLFKQHSVMNTPNIGAIIAFSHRISCLVATEVLAENCEKERAHVIMHFINMISNCNKHNNFQACHNILAGLQNPSIFRLHSSWAYLRRKHASKYRTFERFCRQYRDPRMKLYQQVFHRASLNPPYLPSISHIIAQVLGRIPKRTEAQLTQIPLQQGLASFEEDNLPPCISSPVKNNFDKCEKELVQGQSKVQRFLSAFKIWAPLGQQMSSSSENSSNLEQCDACSINNNNEHLENSGDHKRLPLCECKHKFIVDLNNFFEPLIDANSPDEDTIEMHIVQILKHQRAVERYALCEDDIAKDFLLKEKYNEEIENFKRSLEIEP